MPKVRVPIEVDVERNGRTQWTATVGTVTVSAESAAAARTAIAKEAQQALEGTYVPRVIALDGQTAVVWREPQGGWQYCCNPGRDFHGKETPHSDLRDMTGSYCATRGLAERRARRSLATLVDDRRIAHGLPPIGASILDWQMDKEDHNRDTARQEAEAVATLHGLTGAQVKAYGHAVSWHTTMDRACVASGCPPFDLPPVLAEALQHKPKAVPAPSRDASADRDYATVR